MVDEKHNKNQPKLFAEVTNNLEYYNRVELQKNIQNLLWVILTKNKLKELKI